ncbi:hypothetical protein U9092_23430, partial [Escherichia coli]
MHAAAQFNTLQPVQDEQRALDPAQLAQGHGQSVLARVAAELALSEWRPLLDRHRTLRADLPESVRQRFVAGIQPSLNIRAV